MCVRKTVIDTIMKDCNFLEMSDRIRKLYGIRGCEGEVAYGTGI